jgi:hypothetical protein
MCPVLSHKYVCWLETKTELSPQAKLSKSVVPLSVTVIVEVELLDKTFVLVTSYCVCISLFLAHSVSSVLFPVMKFRIEKVGRLPVN